MRLIKEGDDEISSILTAEGAKRRRKAHKERQIRKFIPADKADRRRMQQHETLRLCGSSFKD